MKIVSETCPLCNKPVHGPFSLITPDIKSFFLMHFGKVHPKCLVKGSKIGTAPPGMAEAYSGTFGGLDRKIVETLGDVGTTVLYGDFNYLWAQLDERDREKAFTGKIVISFKTPKILFGRVSMGWSPRLLMTLEAMVVILAIALSIIMSYLIFMNVAGFLTPFFIVLIPICIIAAFIAFMIFRSLAICVEILRRQPSP